jgi:hypothetical protein
MRSTAGVLGVAVAMAALSVTLSDGVASAAGGIGDLSVTVTFDKAEYTTADLITVTETVTNHSGSTVSGVHAPLGGAPSGASELVGDTNGSNPALASLLHNGPGVDLAAGQSVSETFTGYAADPTKPTVGVAPTFFVDDGHSGGGIPVGSGTPVTAKLTETFGDVSGVVFIDKNGNGKPDPGEGFAGATVDVSRQGNVPNQPKATTDADGRFGLAHQPTGPYGLFVERLSGGWIPRPLNIAHPGQLMLTTAGLVTDFVAERPLSERLHATIAFDQPNYQVGDTAHVTVTLSNSGSTPINGIVADCNRVGDYNELKGTGPGWGALARTWSDPPPQGVAVAAGETKTFHVTDTVPAAAREYGYVEASCQFGPQADNPEGYPSAQDTAKVLGLTVDFPLQLTDTSGNAVANTKVYLLDHFGNHAPLAHAVSDAGGHVVFPALNVGLYTLYVVGPWQAADGTGDVQLQVHTDPREQVIKLKAGPDRPDLVGTTGSASATGTASGDAPASGQPVLANTGVDVRWPLTGAAVLVLLGGLVLVAVRRRASR